jgi:hypothetical protein
MAETIGKIVLTYDVSDKNEEVKDALKELGYSDAWQNLSTHKNYHMPDTTVWHASKEVSQVIKEIKEICDDLDVILKKAFATLTANEVAGYN